MEAITACGYFTQEAGIPLIILEKYSTLENYIENETVIILFIHHYSMHGYDCMH